MTTASGIPLAFQITAANEPDLRRLLPLLEDFRRVTGRPGRPLQRPQVVIADKGYDSKPLTSRAVR